MSSKDDILQVQGINSKGFGVIPKMVMQDKRLTAQSKAIYAYFCSYAGAGKTAFPSRTKIMDDLGMSKETYYRHFNNLKELGYIKSQQEHKKGRFERNIYTLMQEVINTEKQCPTLQCPKKQDTEKQYPKNKDSNNNIFKNKQSFKNISQSSQSEADGQDTTDISQTIETYTEMLKENIRYKDLIQTNSRDIKLVDEMILIMLDAIITNAKTVRIGNEDKPIALVKSVFMKLTYEDIEHVVWQYKGVTERIAKKKQYLLTMLYNSKMENTANLVNKLPLQYR